jgi:hypothetical protein
MTDQMTVDKPAVKPTEAKKAPEVKDELEKQIEVLEPVAKVVERKLKLDGEERTFVQHEMSFFSKIKFFRLMSGTLRLATEQDGGQGGGVADLIQEAFVGAQQLGNQEVANVFLDAVLRLVELAPDFLEETYLLALNVKPEQTLWVSQAFQELDDEVGIDILDTFVAQNGKAISDFFSKRLGKLTKRVQEFIPAAQDQQDQSETTT